MSERISLTYYYVSPKNHVRIENIKRLTGGTEKGILTEFVREYILLRKEDLLKFAAEDAESKNISLGVWGKTIFEFGINGLPKSSKKPNKVYDPLQNYSLIGSEIRRPINYITLGKLNAVLYKILMHINEVNSVELTTKIVIEHLDRNWESLYIPQLMAEKFENWGELTPLVTA